MNLDQAQNYDSLLSRYERNLQNIHVNRNYINPHELTTTLDISRLPETQQPSLDDGCATTGLQAGEENYIYTDLTPSQREECII